MASFGVTPPSHYNAEQKRQLEMSLLVTKHSTNNILKQRGDFVDFAKSMHKVIVEGIVRDNNPDHLTNHQLNKWFLNYHKIENYISATGQRGIINVLSFNCEAVALQTRQYEIFDNPEDEEDAATVAWRQRMDDLLDKTEYSDQEEPLLQIIRGIFIKYM